MNVPSGIASNRMGQESPVTEELLLRVALVCSAALLLQLAFSAILSAPVTQYRAEVAIPLAAGLLGLGLLAVASLRQPPLVLRWLILGACLCDLMFRALIWGQTAQPLLGQFAPFPDRVVTDSSLYVDMAGELLRHGNNPYTWDFSGAFDLYRTTQSLSTPRLQGDYESYFPYPALAFLLVIPFQLVGLPGSETLLIVTHAGVLVTLFAAAPRRYQSIILLPLVAGVDFVNLALIGAQDILWIAFLVGMILSWRRPTLRAVLFGLASASKQGPWLVLPFLLIRLWRDEEAGALKRAGYFALVSGMTFLAFNGPFIVWGPAAWLRGALGPLQDDLALLSHGGLASLTQIGFAYLPKEFFLVATASVMAVCVVMYWRHYATLRDGFWILPGIFMWLSYRSLVSYWIYWAFPMLAVVVTRPPSLDAPRARRTWPLTFITAGLLAIMLLASGIALASRAGSVDVQLSYPLQADSGGHVTRARVIVTNRSQHTLTPRFAIHQSYDAHPLPWYVDQGPFALRPGEAAEYEIFSQRADRAPWAHDGAQIIVTDAGGNYDLRGIATIQPDLSYLWPDAIPNPSYRLWDSTATAPAYWQLVSSDTSVGSASLVNQSGRNALQLSLEPQSHRGQSRVALEVWAMFPERPFGIWVYWDPPATDPGALRQSLEISDSHHVITFQFGAREAAYSVTRDQYLIERQVPPRTWVYETINLPETYAQAQWPLPALEPAAYRGLDTDLRLITLRLVLAARDGDEPSHAFFGPINQNYEVSPVDLMAETLNDPGRYYVRLAENYARQRNYARALEAIDIALQFTADDPEALVTLDHVLQRLNEIGSP